MNPLEQLKQARDYFELFSIPAQFTLDRSFLEKQYLHLSRLTHPDFAQSDPDTQLEALQLASQVNEAYAILKDDLRRGEYFLGLRTGQTGENDPADPEVLERVFAMREALEAAKQAGDIGSVQTIHQQARQWFEAIMAEFGNRMDALDTGEATRRLLAAGRYVRKITLL